MVVFVNEYTENISFSTMFKNLIMNTENCIHEYHMSILAEQYKYLCETGEAESKDDINKKKENWAKTIISKFRAAIDRFFAAFKNKLENIKKNIKTKYKDIVDFSDRTVAGFKVDKAIIKSSKQDFDIEKVKEEINNITNIDKLREKCDQIQKDDHEEYNELIRKNNMDNLEEKCRKIRDNAVKSAYLYSGTMGEAMKKYVSDINPSNAYTN